jgi:hypothetical protein
VAEAHRWAFLAAPEAPLGGTGGLLCGETRLEAVEFHKSYHTTEVGVSPVSNWRYRSRVAIHGGPQGAPND